MATNSQNHKFQQIRVRVAAAGDIVVINAELEKQYKRVKGIQISFPEENAQIGTTLGVTVNQREIFPDAYEAKMLTSNNSVGPNSKYFILPWNVEADGAPVTVRLHDGANNPYLQAGSPAGGAVPVNPLAIVYPYDAIVKFWLTNDVL